MVDGAHVLWNFLDNPNPTGPPGAEQCVGAEIIEAAKGGRENVMMAIEIGATHAHGNWRPKCAAEFAMADMWGNYTIPTIRMRNYINAGAPLFISFNESRRAYSIK